MLVGGNIERIVTMGLASMAETITVTGESPMVDTRKSGISTNYSKEYNGANAAPALQHVRLRQVGARHVGDTPDAG